MHLWSIKLQKRNQDYTMKKKTVFSIMVLKKLDSYMLKNEIRTHFNTTHKINSRWIKDLNVRTAKSLQSCPTLCDPTDGSPPGSTIPGILQARTLEWVAISFFNALKWKVKVKSLSAWLFATPWTAAYQAPSSMGFSRQEYWSGCLCLLQIFSRKRY